MSEEREIWRLAAALARLPSWPIAGHLRGALGVRTPLSYSYRAMLQAAEQLGYVGMMHDPLTRRRFRLPARMRGCGIRSRAWLAPIAFTACFVEAVEGMMGVTDAGLPALFEQLTDVFGVGAFAPT